MAFATFHKLTRAALALSAAAMLVLTPPMLAGQHHAAYANGPESVADLASGLLDAVVNISTSQNKPGEDEGDVPVPDLPEGSPFKEYFDEFFKDKDKKKGPGKTSSLGSGFVIDAKEGIVITNNHVIDGGDAIEVIFADGTKIPATLKGTDPKTDIAVLQIDPGKHKLTEVKFGDSTAMRIGDWVMAIGNPFGLGGSVSVGIVSAINRDINSGPYDDFIQTDAAINRGNSGGPLFNMKGEVIGINTAIISPSGGSIGIGFSIPSKLAVSVIDQLRQFGETRRGWLGVRIQPVSDDIAESLGMTSAKGALVAGIVKGGPVDDGSVEAGDVIIKFDGRDVKDMRDLPRIVAESPVGKDVDVVVIRKGKEINIKVRLGRLEDGDKLASAEDGKTATEEKKEEVVSAKALGMAFAELDDKAREAFGIAKEINGVLVTSVDDNSLAAERGVKAGDVITEIAQESVSKPGDVLTRLEKLKAQGRKNALLMLASKSGELRFVTIRME